MSVFWRLAQLQQDRRDTPAAEEILREGITFAWEVHGQGHELALKAVLCATNEGSSSARFVLCFMVIAAASRSF